MATRSVWRIKKRPFRNALYASRLSVDRVATDLAVGPAAAEQALH